MREYSNTHTGSGRCRTTGSDRTAHAGAYTGTGDHTGSCAGDCGGRKYPGYYSISTVCGSTGDGGGLPFLDSICQQKSGTGERGSGDQRREVTGFPECGKAGRRRYLLYFKKGRRMVLRGIRNRSWFCGEKSASQDRR